MSEQTEKKLLRQLKLINFWISFYGIIMIVLLGTLTYFIIQMVMFVRDTNQRIDSLRSAAADSVNIEKRLCEDGGTLGGIIKSQTNLCKNPQK